MDRAAWWDRLEQIDLGRVEMKRKGKRRRRTTLVQTPAALGYLARTVGTDRIVLGSDHPFWMGDPEPLRVVRDAGLGADAETAIAGANAGRLFRLSD